MLFLSRKVKSWVEEGLITGKQGQSILRYENNKAAYLSPMMLFAFVGVFSIGIGIVALIAANWYEISNFAKITALFSSLLGVIFLAERFQEKKPAFFQICLFLLMMLFFGAIGLIGQIYNLSSATYESLFLWCALTFPLMFLTQKLLFGWTWGLVFTFAFCSSPLFEEVNDILVYLKINLIGLSGILFTLYALLQLINSDLVIVKPMKQIVGFSALITLLFPVGNSFDEQELFSTFMLILSVVVASGARLLKVNTAVQIYVLCALFGFFSTAGSELPLFIGQISILGVLVWGACSKKDERFARLIIFLIALRVLIAYFSLFGTLMQTGIGLIMTGLFLIGMALGWYKLDRKLKVGLKA